MKRFSLYRASGWHRLLMAIAMTTLIWSLVMSVIWR